MNALLLPFFCVSIVTVTGRLDRQDLKLLVIILMVITQVRLKNDRSNSVHVGLGVYACDPQYVYTLVVLKSNIIRRIIDSSL